MFQDLRDLVQSMLRVRSPCFIVSRATLSSEDRFGKPNPGPFLKTVSKSFGKIPQTAGLLCAAASIKRQRGAKNRLSACYQDVAHEQISCLLQAIIGGANYKLIPIL